MTYSIYYCHTPRRRVFQLPLWTQRAAHTCSGTSVCSAEEKEEKSSSWARSLARHWLTSLILTLHFHTIPFHRWENRDPERLRNLPTFLCQNRDSPPRLLKTQRTSSSTLFCCLRETGSPFMKMSWCFLTVLKFQDQPEVWHSSAKQQSLTVPGRMGCWRLSRKNWDRCVVPESRIGCLLVQAYPKDASEEICKLGLSKFRTRCPTKGQKHALVVLRLGELGDWPSSKSHLNGTWKPTSKMLPSNSHPLDPCD